MIPQDGGWLGGVVFVKIKDLLKQINLCEHVGPIWATSDKNIGEKKNMHALYPCEL